MSNNWRPIETAPKDGTFVLIYGPKMGRAISRYWHSQNPAIPNWQATMTSFYDNAAVTHWMPLPDSPQ